MGVVPVAFAVALLVASVADLSVVQAMVIAATIGVLVIVDACCVDTPRGRR